MKKIKLLTILSAFALATAGALGLASLKEGKKAFSASATYSQGDVIANDKARIWIGYDSGNPFYSYADADTGIRLWIHSTSSGGTEKVYGTITGTFNNGIESNRRYDYFDVDLAHYTNGWYMTVQKFQNGGWKGQTNPIQLSSSNACKVYWVWGDWAWDQTAGTVAAGSVDAVDAGFAAKALGGIHTCSSSNINGYNAFPNYNSTFVKDGENWKTSGNLSDYTLNDFANGDTAYSGSAATSTNAYDKYVEVQSIYNNGGVNSSKSLFVAPEKSTTVVIIAVVSLASITAISGFFFVKKRKSI